MELFGTIRIILANCLYYPNQTHIFNVERSLVTFAAFLVVVSHFLFLFYEANDITAYVSSAYMTVTVLGVFVSFLNTTFKTKTIFALIDIHIEEIPKRSK